MYFIGFKHTHTCSPDTASELWVMEASKTANKVLDKVPFITVS